MLRLNRNPFRHRKRADEFARCHAGKIVSFLILSSIYGYPFASNTVVAPKD
jgi:hypothetical protein